VSGSRFVPLAVFVVTAVVLMIDLGGQYVWSKDEARDGLVVREMVEMGHWLIPHIGGRVYPYKPPLFHWLVALSSLQGVTEWSLRLPSVLAAAATVALTYAMGARRAGPITGLVAAAVLASSATFVEWARAGRLEMLLVLWLTLGFWSALRWLDEGKRRSVVVLGLALGLGCLTKGPVGLVPLGTLIIAVALLGRWSRGTLTDLGLALALAVALPAAWLGIAAGAHDGLHEYVDAVIANFANEVRVLRNQHPLFAAEEIGVGFLPWTLALPAAVLVLVRRWRTSWRALVLPLLWVGFVLATFTIFISPRAVYFLPIYPALALVVAWTWSASSSAERRWMLWPLVTVVIASTTVGIGLTIWPLTIELQRHVTVLSRDVGIGVTVIGSATVLGVGVLLKRGPSVAVPVVIGAGALLVLVLLQVTVRTPRANRAYPTREVAARFVAALPSEAEVAYVDRNFTTGVMFYIKQRHLELLPTSAMPHLLPHPLRYALIPRDVMALIWQDGPLMPPLHEETMSNGRYVLLNLNGAAGTNGARSSREAPVPLTLSVRVNQSTFAVGQVITATASLDNPGRPGSADLYLGALFPDGVTIVFYTGPGGIVVGSRADLRSFRPYTTGISLTTPFSTRMSSFFSHHRTSSDPRGNYVFFHLAVQAGALADGIATNEEILGLARAPFSLP
jgi:4-amino-4-deoxy-L-arabinose transferase-like glycosyltransferase